MQNDNLMKIPKLSTPEINYLYGTLFTLPILMKDISNYIS